MAYYAYMTSIKLILYGNRAVHELVALEDTVSEGFESWRVTH